MTIRQRKFLNLVLILLIMGSSCFGLLDNQVQGQEKKIKITIAAGTVGQEFELAQEAAQNYMDKHPNVKVELFDSPQLADDRFGLYRQFLGAKDSTIDIYQIDVIWPGALAEHFVDLDQYVPDKVVDQHFDAIIKNNTVKGKLVALPWFTNAGLLYYRKDLLKKYGFKPPETWSQLEKIARVIMKKEKKDGNTELTGFVWQGDVYEGLTCNALEWIASHDGGQIIEPDGTVTINNPQAVKALNRAANWIGDISPTNVTNMSEDDARKIFQSGKAVFMRNWPYAYSMAQQEGSPIKGKVGVTSLPAGPGGQSAGTLGGAQLAVSKYSDHLETAVDVVLFLTSYEEQKRRAIEGAFNPTIKQLYKDTEVLEAVPFFAYLYDVFTNAVPRPSTATAPHYKKVSREFYTEVYNVLNDRQTASKAVNYLEDKYLDMALKPADDTAAKQTTTNEKSYFYYTVKRGDTLYKISKKYNITIQYILKLNEKITNPNVIIAGQKLKLPK